MTRRLIVCCRPLRRPWGGASCSRWSESGRGLVRSACICANFYPITGGQEEFAGEHTAGQRWLCAGQRWLCVQILPVRWFLASARPARNRSRERAVIRMGHYHDATNLDPQGPGGRTRCASTGWRSVVSDSDGHTVPHAGQPRVTPGWRPRSRSLGGLMALG
jgi:hypothetical protein